jgi:hypothetical protein
LRSQINRIESQLAALTRQVPSPNRPLNPPTLAPSVPPEPHRESYSATRWAMGNGQ